VLTLLRKDEWLVKESTCAFGQRRVSYLGHVVSEQGVATDPARSRKLRTGKELLMSRS
jgi:hypothetical protein